MLNEEKILYELQDLLKNSDYQNHLISLKEGFKESNEIMLVLELMEGDLGHFDIGVKHIPQILKEIVPVLKKMHQFGYVHFDIRPGIFH